MFVHDLAAGQLVALARIEGDDVVDLLGEDGGVLRGSGVGDAYPAGEWRGGGRRQQQAPGHLGHGQSPLRW